MVFDAEMLKKLVEIFQGELEESTNILINGLVALEKAEVKSENRTANIEVVFRTAHNLKGAARGLGINTIGDIAHHIESIFSYIKASDAMIKKATIDVCLEAVDRMHSAMLAFSHKSELDFDLNDLIKRLQACITVKVTTPPVIINEESSKPAAIIPSATTVTSDSIRVSLKVIDKLSELSEEIQAGKIEMEDDAHTTKKLAQKIQEVSSAWKEINTEFRVLADDDSDHLLRKLYMRTTDDILEIGAAITELSQNMTTKANDYSRLSRAIQDEVSLLRLVPVNNYLALLPRYIRELSTELHKSAELEVKGGEVYIDKYVLEGLKDPINHLLRNAIDHGIETPQQRLQAGKSESGKITISVRDAGNRVFIEISDDGAGLDYEQIKNKIIKMNPSKINDIDELTLQQIEDFIFHSGFSTRDEVSNISGRGIGLDVVRKNVQVLKGTVTLENQPGHGIKFIISVPLSISSERGLVVRSEGFTFVLPTASIARVQIFNPDDIVNIAGSQAVLIDGHPVLLKSLATVLNIGENITYTDAFSAAILMSTNLQVALAVDQVLGEREIVIKSIQEPLSNINCVAGATLLDRNKIAIVLDPAELLNLSFNTVTQYIIPNTPIDFNKIVETNRILVVDDSITTRTLEKNILESKNFQVTTAVNGQEAWEILQKHSFNLIITDVNMPLMDGFELTEKIKKSDKLASVPVIIVTSLGSDAEKARGVDVGADAYIVKNEFESGVLLQIISQLI